jgi:hypothetical protein
VQLDDAILALGHMTQSIAARAEAVTVLPPICPTICVTAENGDITASVMAKIATTTKARTERKQPMGKLFLSVDSLAIPRGAHKSYFATTLW